MQSLQLCKCPSHAVSVFHPSVLIAVQATEQLRDDGWCNLLILHSEFRDANFRLQKYIKMNNWFLCLLDFI